MGSFIHCLVLQPDEFYLVKDLDKPSSKLGMVIDEIKSFRKQGFTIYDSIIHACNVVHYYENSITNNRIKKIISSGFNYYINNKYENDERALIPTSKERKVVESCVSNLTANKQIQNLLKPIDIWGDEILSFNEDAFFIDFNATHRENSCILKFKMKADN